MSSDNKLETRIASSLGNGSAPSSAALMELSAETVAAAEAAEQVAVAARERALDVVASPDVGAAHGALVVSELYRDRLQAVLPKLRMRLSEALAAEAAERWRADFERVEQRRDPAAVKFAERYPQLLAELVALLRECEAVDQEALRVNSLAPAAEPRRLRSVELTARGLTEFSTSQPSISTSIRLPDWERSDQMLWPVLRPNDFAVAVAESMKPPHDLRFTNRWWEVAEADRAERLRLAERRDAQQQADAAQARADYERTLLKAEEEREARAQAARRRG
jgi:hypothetical protein